MAFGKRTFLLYGSPLQVDELRPREGRIAKKVLEEVGHPVAVVKAKRREVPETRERLAATQKRMNNPRN